MKLSPILLSLAKAVGVLTILCVDEASAEANRIEAKPQSSSMRGRMMAAVELQFGVRVSGTLEQRIGKLQRELRLLEFTSNNFPALSNTISYAGTNVPMIRCVSELSRLVGKAIPIELGTNDFSTGEFVFVDLPLVDVLKYLVAFDDELLDVQEGKLVCRPIHEGLALKAEEYDLLKLMTSQRYKEVEEILTKPGPDVRHIRDNDQQTLLHFAAWFGQRAILSRLIELGADVNAKSNSGATALHEAAHFGNVACVELLLRSGADVSIADNNNDTPLETALYYGYRNIAKLLVEHGATLDIYTAAGLGMVEQVRRILDETGSAGWTHATGPKDRHSVFGGYGVTPLHCAAQGGSVEAASLLIERGVPVSRMDSQGNTPLHWAAAAGQLETAKILITKGADVNGTNRFGCTPLLSVARAKAAPEIVELLVHSGAKVEATDHSGENALHKLAWFGYPEENIRSAQTLLDAGADVNAKNRDGKTPLDILSDNQFQNDGLVKLYREYSKRAKPRGRVDQRARGMKTQRTADKR